MEKIVELIFEACVKYDEREVVNNSPFYYDCDELFKQDSLNGLKIKKNNSLKAVDKVHRVNLMNHIAQKKTELMSDIAIEELDSCRSFR